MFILRSDAILRASSKSLVLLIILTLPFFSFFSSGSQSESYEDSQNALQQLVNSHENLAPRLGITSEEENIDSFDVNPKSGRWNVSESGATDDLIVDGNLRLITTENTTDASSEYFMERGLQKTDSNIEYRYKATVDNQSQVEYARDVLGDSWGFEEGDQEGWLADYSGNSVSNGIFTFVSEADNGGIRYTSALFFGYETFSSVEFRVKTDISSSNMLRIFFNGASTQLFEAFSTTSEWQIFTISLADFSISGSPSGLAFRMDFETASAQDTYNVEFSLDYFKLIGDLDYATHVEGEVEDTWDWGDSLEYFYDEEDDVQDFEDNAGMWNDYNANNVVGFAGGYMQLLSNTTGVATVSETISDTISIDSSEYNWFTMEFWYQTTARSLIQIIIYDGGIGANAVCSDSSGWSSTTWHLFSCNLDDDADWSGTETLLRIIFVWDGTTTTNDLINVEMVYLYDTELGDQEGWTNSNITAVLQYVQPEGYMHITFAQDLSTSNSYLTIPNTQSMDSSVFDTFKIRIKSSATNYFRLVDSSSQIASDQQVTTSFVEYTFDLSSDSDWSGIETRFIIYFRDESNGAIDIGDKWEIDYILLEASEEQEQDFTLGFWDKDNQQALANVTHHFFNSTTFRWEVELYDSNQEIASYYYSANQTVTNEYFQGKIGYNILESEFELRITANNGSNIFRVDWRKEFTTTGLPSLFAFEKSPYIFLSAYSVFYGSQEIWIDFVNAPYKEKTWRQVTTPSDTDWIIDQTYETMGQGVIADETSTWRLNLQYFDTLSSSMVVNSSNNGNLATDTSFSGTSTFTIYSVDKDDGELHEIFWMAVQQVSTGSAISSRCTATVGGVPTFSKTYVGINDASPTLDFSIASFQERTQLSAKFQCFPKGLDNTVSETSFANASLSDYVDSLSQEIVLEIKYRILFKDNTFDWFAYHNAFAFITKELFEDFGTSFVGKLGDIFDGFIQTIIQFLVFLLAPVLLFLTLAMNALSDALQPLLQSLIEATTAIANAIWNALRGFLEDFVNDIISFIASALTDVWNDIILPLINFFLGMLATVYYALISAGQGVIDAIIAWALGFLGLSDVWITAGDFFTFILALIFYIFVVAVFAFFSGPIVVSSSPGEVLENYWHVWSMDITFGMSFLGIRIYIPFAFFMVAWIIIMGYADTLFTVVPF